VPQKCDLTMNKKSRPHVVFLCSLPALILSLVCLVPYLDKAFLIDDPVFLLQAQQILKEPRHPMALNICWVNQCEPVSANMPGDFLMSYYLAPVVNGLNPERRIHLMQIVTLWCGIVAMVSLALRFGFEPFAAVAAGLVLVATPPVLAMASTAMPEVLALALAVVGLERLWAWKENGKAIDGLISLLALGLAPIARLHLVLLWPVAAVLLRDDGQIFDAQSWIRLPMRKWLPLIGAAFVSFTVVALTHEPGSGLKPTHMLLSPESFNHNLLSYLSYWMIAMPLGAAWVVLRNRDFRGWLFPIVMGLLFLRFLGLGGRLFWLAAGLGAVVLVDILLWSLQSQDHRRIACFLWLLPPLVALPYIHLPVKLLVPCAPAAALLVADILPAFRWRKTALCAMVAIGTVFGSMVLHADYRFAEMGRQAAERLVKPQVASGHRVWIASEWGLYWYALKAGGQVLWTNDVPARGDYLVRGELEGYPVTIERLPPAIRVEIFRMGGPGGRTMSPRDNAGLYSNWYGDLMWAWGTGEWNHYELWQFQ
jgi:hypothetical protein